MFATRTPLQLPAMKGGAAKSTGKEAHKLTHISPHVYGVGERAFSQLNRTGRAQCVIMSGESGAGKTETTKYLLKYLTRCSVLRKAGGAGGGRLDAIGQQVLQSSSIHVSSSLLVTSYEAKVTS